ncbi:MAG: hypothetical protein ABN480_05510 [Dickeya sp.]|jgi:hypothetical protein|nr:hypothetical protein DFO54_12219 [Erwinia sp. AG740]UJR54506.1 hypothetical protein J417_10905 [Dickeya zeae MS1]
MISSHYRLRFQTELLTNTRFGIIIGFAGATGLAGRAGSGYEVRFSGVQLTLSLL